MKIKTKLFRKIAKPVMLVSVMFSALFGAVAKAELQPVTANIVRTLADSYYGGCMVLLDVSVATVLPNCGPGWVSLDCDATYHTPAQSNAMWTSALTAFALNKPITVWVEDTQIVDGYCTARRLDVRGD